MSAGVACILFVLDFITLDLFFITLQQVVWRLLVIFSEIKGCANGTINFKLR